MTNTGATELDAAMTTAVMDEYRATAPGFEPNPIGIIRRVVEVAAAHAAQVRAEAWDEGYHAGPMPNPYRTARRRHANTRAVGAVPMFCYRCEWVHEGGTEDEQLTAFLAHANREHLSEQ